MGAAEGAEYTAKCNEAVEVMVVTSSQLLTVRYAKLRDVIAANVISDTVDLFLLLDKC